MLDKVERFSRIYKQRMYTIVWATFKLNSPRLIPLGYSFFHPDLAATIRFVL